MPNPCVSSSMARPTHWCESRGSVQPRGRGARRCHAEYRGIRRCAVRLTTDPSVPAEGFRISSDEDGVIQIAGGDDRGVLYGVGKLLHTSRFGDGEVEFGAWRGTSVPARPIRGMYFATHFGNFYAAAPVEAIERYVEELALWGCNALAVWFDMHTYRGLDDRQRRRWSTGCDVFSRGESCGHPRRPHDTGKRGLRRQPEARGPTGPPATMATRARPGALPPRDLSEQASGLDYITIPK